MRYKVITSNKEGNFTIRKSELNKLYKAINTGSVATFREGWLNPSHFVSLVADKKRTERIREDMRLGREPEEPSPFAHMAIEKGAIKTLSPAERSDAQDDAEREA